MTTRKELEGTQKPTESATRCADLGCSNTSCSKDESRDSGETQHVGVIRSLKKTIVFLKFRQSFSRSGVHLLQPGRG